MKSSTGEFFPADFGGGLGEGTLRPQRVLSATQFDDCTLRLIGNSPAMQKVRDLIGRVAPTDSTVLICGESGCGKELVAESVHAMSPRADKPFVAINCAAIPATLIEAELFGHERGSFTGAMRTREGVFERTRGGTLLLDEITEMPLELQSRLLRVLETKRLSRVGGSSDLEVDVRVLASTNRSPAQAFDEGRLREDIYYRLAVVTVQLPPLRERGDDVLVLAEFFLAELNLRDAYVRPAGAGVIQTRQIETGQYVQPGTVIATLVRRDPLLLRFRVPEAEAAALAPGMPARFTLPSGAGEAYSATIRLVGAAASEADRMVTVTAEVDDPKRGDLRPGAFAQVSVPVGKVAAPVIPQTAIRPSERGFLAYVVNGDTAEERVVELGLRTADGQVEVRKGLRIGEELVVRGAEALRTGAKVVRAAPEAAAAPAATSDTTQRTMQ